MNSRDSLIGTVYDDRYLLKRRIGQGGMANVYLGDDQTLGREVAIKVLSMRYAEDDQFVERFMREASSAARLNHPNIVQVYDRGEANHTYYIAMEYVEGETLKDIILRDGALPDADLFEYTRQALHALRFAHRNGVVHRDIKPHNMMIDTEGRLKIADFGIARAGADQGLTEGGSIVGTAQYLSPEQARGETVSASSDLYSIGIVMYEMATGKVPFEGDSPVNVALKHINEAVPRPSDERRSIPAPLEAVIVRALQKDPQQRYQTADEMLDDLEKARRGVLPASTSAMTQVLGTGAAAGMATTHMPAVERTRVGPPAPVASDAGSAYANAHFPEDDDQGKRKRSIWPWLLLLALVAAVAGIAYFVTQEPDVKQVAVPNVESQREEAAKRTLEAAGLKIGETTRESSEQEPAGEVISTDPGAGEEVDEGTTVDLVVSSGPETFQVPDWIGDQLRVAKNEAQDRGLELKVTQVQTEDHEPGVVFQQDPAGGTEVKKGDTIRITVARELAKVEVPSVVGLDEANAKDRLQKAGFVVDSDRVDSAVPEGQVIAQDPEAGTEATKGSTVTLQVSGPNNTVPDVVGQPQSEAETALKEAGFEVDLDEKLVNDPSIAGDEPEVTEQNPSANVSYRKGETVTITVRKFDPAGEAP